MGVLLSDYPTQEIQTPLAPAKARTRMTPTVLAIPTSFTMYLTAPTHKQKIISMGAQSNKYFATKLSKSEEKNQYRCLPIRFSSALGILAQGIEKGK